MALASDFRSALSDPSLVMLFIVHGSTKAANIPFHLSLTQINFLVNDIVGDVI